MKLLDPKLIHFLISNKVSLESKLVILLLHCAPRGGGTLGISGWGCAARTLEPLAYTRASFSWILLPYNRVNSPNHSYPGVAIAGFLSQDKIFNELVSLVKNDNLF